MSTGNYSPGLLTNLLLAKESCTVDQVARTVLENFWKVIIKGDEDTRIKGSTRLRQWLRFFVQKDKLSQ